MTIRNSYFLISVSTRENLELCIKYALAGFPSSKNGLWTFLEINEGDFVSFLFGAKVYNLYKIKEKIAIKNAEDLPPWKPIVLRTYKKSYWFPFRLTLEPIREFQESLVRTEFSYVSENLLLRGGYMKTHFQADQTTLQNVSEMGKIFNGKPEALDLQYETFIPIFTIGKTDQSNVIKLKELILQSAIRQHLLDNNRLKEFLDLIDITGMNYKSLEVLGEKALPQGHIDILIKEAVPIGSSKKIVIEIKLNKASEDDLQQVKSYVDELGKECISSVLIAKDFPKKFDDIAENSNMKLIKYSLDNLKEGNFTFNELKHSIKFKLL